MEKNIKLFNPYATECLNFASYFAEISKLNEINWDSLFRGAYFYARNHQYFDLFCNVVWLYNIEALDKYFMKTKYNEILKTKKDWKDL